MVRRCRQGLSMGCYFVSEDESDSEYTITGTVRFDERSTTRAHGDLDLHLVGDVPSGTVGIFAEDTTLDFHWYGFVAPSLIDSCD